VSLLLHGRQLAAGTNPRYGRSERAGWGEPDALETQISPRVEDVVVAVIVEHTDVVALGDGGHDQVDGRQPVMPDACELTLSVGRSAFHVCVDREPREGEELFDELAVRNGVARGVPGFEEKRQTHRDPSASRALAISSMRSDAREL
jgi:hypothetical protein